MNTIGRWCWGITLAMIYAACFARWPGPTFTVFAVYNTRSLWDKEPTK